LFFGGKSEDKKLLLLLNSNLLGKKLKKAKLETFGNYHHYSIKDSVFG